MMKFTLNVRDIADLDLLEGIPADSIVLQTHTFSRFGGIRDHEILEAVRLLRFSGRRIILAWDCLLNDRDLNTVTPIMRSVIEDCDAVRFLDPGVGRYLLTAFPGKELELSLEHGSFSSAAVLQWTKSFASSLSRVILSSQLPLETLRAICKQSSIDVEILAYGPLEILYSKRALLPDKSLFNKHNGRILTIASKDRPQQKNPILMTDKGTLIFFDKRINLFHLYNQISDIGVGFLRIEYLHQEELKSIQSMTAANNWIEVIAGDHDDQTRTEAFIRKNVSHEAFDLLSNRHLETGKESKIGSVIEVVNKTLCLIRVEQPITMPQSIMVLSPEGRKICSRLDCLLDLKGTMHRANVQPGIYRSTWIKYVVPGSLIIPLATIDPAV